MSKAKSYKIITLLLACLLSLACFFASISFVKVSADSSSDYFTLNGSASEKVVFDGTAVSAEVVEKDTLAFKNSLSASDLTLTLSGLDKVSVFTVAVQADSFGVDGNKDENGEYQTSIKNKLVIDVENGTASLNGATGASFTLAGEMEIVFSVENNYLTAKVEGAKVDLKETDYYKLKSIDKVPADVSFYFDTLVETANEETVANFKIISVGQKTGDDAYTQNFVLDADGKLTPAKARVSLGDNFFNGTADNVNVISGYQYKPTITVLSVLGKGTNSYLFVTGDSANNNIVISQNSVTFKLSVEDYEKNASKTMNFNIVDKEDNVIEVYNVNVITDSVKEGNAPKYVNATSAQAEIERFKDLLNERTKTEYEVDGQKITASVRIGSGEYLEIPSLKNLVTDNATAYENLTMTIRYRTRESAWATSSNKKIPLNVSGTYEFYVMFKDLNGNTMEYADFIDESDGVDNPVYGIYKDYIFTFTVLDDAPISVEAANQGKGYKGIEFNATGFTIKASDYTAKYSLFYRADENSSWVKIPLLSEIDEDYSENGFTYKDIESIAYDGLLTFTPNKLGQYKIVCDVISNSSLAKSQSAEAVIKVEDVPTKVVPENHWLKDNVWSVLFLTVGTLSLVAIIVLLTYKPKDGANTKRKK